MTTRKYSTALVGQKFNHWTVVGYSHYQNCQDFWVFKCDCGVVRPVVAMRVLKGRPRSCGCKNPVNKTAIRTAHGQSGTPEHKLWKSLRGRCDNPKNPRFEYYGGRGIKVCQGWRAFPNFKADVGTRPSVLHSLDRVDNDGNYSCGKCDECLANGWPMNVRWATQKQQTRNRRVTQWVEYQGERRPLSDWCERLGIPFTRTDSRLTRGWSIQDAFTLPAQKNNSGKFGGSVAVRKREYGEPGKET